MIIAAELTVAPAGMWKICAKWILNVEWWSVCHILLSTTHFQHWHSERNEFLDSMLLVCKSWMPLSCQNFHTPPPPRSFNSAGWLVNLWRR
jgi:hypothetical protein